MHAGRGADGVSGSERELGDVVENKHFTFQEEHDKDTLCLVKQDWIHQGLSTT